MFFLVKKMEENGEIYSGNGRKMKEMTKKLEKKNGKIG